MKQVHEYAELFPPLEPDEFDKLVTDIRENGLHHPIMLFEDKLLDGVNREKACQKAHVRPEYKNFKGKADDALAYVISENIRRRHLNPSQRAMLALELEERFAKEDNSHKGSGPKYKDLTSRERETRGASGRAASIVGVNPNLVRDAKRLAGKSNAYKGSKHIKASPEVLKAVRTGKVTIGEALTELRGARASERAIRQRYQAKMKHLQKNSRQVADFLAACKSYEVALKVAVDSVERFSAPEAQRFVERKLGEIESLITQLRKEMKHAKAA